jgi:hypothetical protein
MIKMMALVALLASQGMNPFTATAVKDLVAKLPMGDVIPKPGLACNGSDYVLGTSNIATANTSSALNGSASTVVNIWSITRGKSAGMVLGWIVKTHDGKLYYTNAAGFRGEEITQQNLGFADLIFHACFTHDLDKSYLGP